MTGTSIPDPPDPDPVWCHEAVQGVSRTFALTVEELEEPMASHICVGYLLCRVADTIEDAAEIPPAAQTELLASYRTALDPEDAGTVADFRRAVAPWVPGQTERSADWDVVAAAPTVVATFHSFGPSVRDAIVPPVLEMVRGMETFVHRYRGVGGLRIQDRPELERYCHYAAGTVGRLVTNLLTRGSSDTATINDLRSTAASFGLLLQLVNIAKDVHRDYAVENNVYLPSEWLERENVEQEAILDPDNRQSVGRVVTRTVRHARTFLDDAHRYISAMPLRHGNTVAAWSVPYLLAVGTLRELSERPEDALSEGGVSIDRAEVFAILSAARSRGRSGLSELREAIESRPFESPTVPHED